MRTLIQRNQRRNKMFHYHSFNVFAVLVVPAAFVLAASGMLNGASATTMNITYDNTTGIVIPDPNFPFNFQITGSGTGSPKFSLIGPVMNVFNVKESPYNAKGDGNTDDTNAIQSAINDALVVGGIVYLPGGTYRFSSLSANTGKDCIIQGAGKDITFLKALSGTTLTLVTLGGTNGAPYSAIRDLTIDASLTNSPSNYALLLYNSSFSEVANVHILGGYNHGIGFTACQSLRIHDCVVENSRNGYGIVTNVSDCSGTTISHCSILNSAISGIQLYGSQETVDHCYISGTNAGPYAGIYVARAGRNCTISNNIIQNCGSVGIDVSFGTASGNGSGDGGPDNSEGIILMGNNCSGNSGGGISTASNGTLIVGNVCKDNGPGPYSDAAGIGVVDARNVIIKGNITGNSAGITNQKYGVLFLDAYDNPINDTVLGNDLRNAIGPVVAENNARQIIPLSTGHIFSDNRGLDDGTRKYTANYTVTSADQGATFANNGATGPVTFTLPAAEEGITYTFMVYPTQSVTITAPSAYIYIGNSHTATTGGSISNGTSGSVITLKGASTGTNARWYAIAHEGTWTIN